MVRSEPFFAWHQFIAVVAMVVPMMELVVKGSQRKYRLSMEERAELYDSYTAQLTSPAIEALLDAAQISPG